MIIDFLIGLFLANAIPHFIFGVMNIRFISLFGFGDLQNLLYSAWNFVLGVGLFVYFYGFNAFLNNGFILGVMFIFLSYVVVGKFLYRLWHLRYVSSIKEKES